MVSSNDEYYVDVTYFHICVMVHTEQLHRRL
jgi:hypothetical protein